jgi:hypothetical protein
VNSIARHLGISLRLHFRNRMGLFYGYLFPLLFLVAFWVLYRYDQVPLVRHVGVLLTITALGGACFGLPTTMVSERERGVWRRYRLAPVGTGSLVASTMVARYLLLLTAGLLQLVLAFALGMPFPHHPFDVWLAFTFVAFAFLGMGLVIAMLADNVPAVQALGQCIFLPMLILGGVAVPLESLPGWAQHLSAFFPGRYAVEAIQAGVDGGGLGAARFPLLALLLIGIAGYIAGVKLFRWDSEQRFARMPGKGWVAAALAGWLTVGVLAESAGHALIAGTTAESEVARTVVFGTGPLYDPRPSPAERVGPQAERDPHGDPSGIEIPPDTSSVPDDGVDPGTREPEPDPHLDLEPSQRTGAEETEPRPVDRTPSPELARDPEPSAAVDPATAAPPAVEDAPWQAVTLEEIDRNIDFTRLPPDGGVITPIARSGAQPGRYAVDLLECMRQWLPEWEPGQTGDPVQRVRNYLDLIALPDLLQMEEIESMVPHVVFERLQADFPRGDLIKILYWIAMHPYDGDEPQLDRLSRVCLTADGQVNLDDLRVRTSIYAAKLLGRLTGHITPR